MNDTNETTVHDQVLVGVDGSTNSIRAFDVALSVAKKQGWRMRLVGSYSTLYSDHETGLTISENYRKAMENNTREPLVNLAKRAEAEGVEVSMHTEEGHPADSLVNESAASRLVVVGKRGRNRFAGRFLGSVSSALAAHSHCPTLIIPEKWETPSADSLFAPDQEVPGGDETAAEPTELLTESSPPKARRRAFRNVTEQMTFRDEFVVGVDLGDAARRVALAAAEYADLFGRPLNLVAATTLNADAWYPNPVEHNVNIPNIRAHFTKQLDDVAAEIATKFPDVTVHWQFFDGTPAGVLSEATRTARLVVLGTRGHGGFTGMLMGSVSQSVLNRAVSPVLVVPTVR